MDWKNEALWILSEDPRIDFADIGDEDGDDSLVVFLDLPWAYLDPVDGLLSSFVACSQEDLDACLKRITPSKG